MNSSKSLKKGFTLIELLVVVGIIAILAGVVLAALNSARTKGADAAVKSDLANMRGQAALYYSNNNTYGPAAGVGSAACATATSMFVDSTVAAQLANAVLSGGGLESCVLVAGTTPSWAVAVQLKSLSSSWCVDGSGASRGETVAGSNQPGLDADLVAATGTCL